MRKKEVGVIHINILRVAQAAQEGRRFMQAKQTAGRSPETVRRIWQRDAADAAGVGPLPAGPSPATLSVHYAIELYILNYTAKEGGKGNNVAIKLKNNMNLQLISFNLSCITSYIHTCVWISKNWWPLWRRSSSNRALKLDACLLNNSANMHIYIYIYDRICTQHSHHGPN